MNGKWIVWPNTNQTSAASPAPMATAVHLSLLRIANSGISEWYVLAIEIDFALDVRSQPVLALGMSEVGGGSRRINRFVVLTGFSVRGSQRSNERRIRIIRNAVEPERKIDCRGPASHRVIGSRGQQPGKIIEREDRVWFQLQSRSIIFDRIVQETFLDKRVAQTNVSGGIVRINRQNRVPLCDCRIKVVLLKQDDTEVVMRVGIIR